MASLKELILGADDLQRKLFECPEWPTVVVYQRKLNGRERSIVEKGLVAASKSGDPGGLRAQVAVMALVDEAGQQVFTMSDATALDKKSGEVLDRLFDEVVKFNRIGERGKQEALGNSPETPSDDSGSD
jgi:hypothetical protein